MANFIDYYRQGKEDRRTEDNEKRQKRFAELVGGMGTNPAAFQEAAAINPQGAMQAKTFYDQQAAQQQQAAEQQSKQAALVSLNKVRVVRTAPPGRKIARWQQIAPEHYAQMVADGTPPTDDEIDQFIDMNIGELYAKAGVDMPAPPVRMENVDGPRGSRIQRNPMTGEEKQVVGPDNSQAPQGLTPYQQAQIDAQNRRIDLLADKSGKGGNVRLPIGALRLVSETQQSIDTAGESLAVIDGAIKTLESGKVKLGMVSNQLNRAKNYVGASDEGSRAYADLNQTLEKLRNNYLLLAKGVQTEGDATRAWNSEIGESTQNDNKLAGQQLKKAKALIERMALLQKDRIDTIYSNYGGARPGPQQPGQGQAPVRVNTPQEAMALPPGTQFVTPDGRVKVRP